MYQVHASVALDVDGNHETLRSPINIIVTSWFKKLHVCETFCLPKRPPGVDLAGRKPRPAPQKAPGFFSRSVVFWNEY
eukprot:1185199-Prorocentrum_minimum.AAC.2